MGRGGGGVGESEGRSPSDKASASAWPRRRAAYADAHELIYFIAGQVPVVCLIELTSISRSLRSLLITSAPAGG